MIRALGLALVASLSFGCAAGRALQHSETPIVAIAKGDDTFCSAFAVGPHEIMTAAHCIDDEDEDELAIVTRELWDHTARGSAPLVVLHVDQERDLALLYTPLRFRIFLKTRPPSDGEHVTAFSGAAGWRHSGGQVLRGFGFFRDTDVSIEHGWSGSPVVGIDGRAVGVVVRCYGKYSGTRHVCSKDDMQFSVLP